MSPIQCHFSRARTGGKRAEAQEERSGDAPFFAAKNTVLSARELALGFQPVVEGRSPIPMARFVDLISKPGYFLLSDLNRDNWYRLIVAGSTGPLGPNGGGLLRVLWCSWHSTPLTSFLDSRLHRHECFSVQTIPTFLSVHTRHAAAVLLAVWAQISGKRPVRAPRCITLRECVVFYVQSTNQNAEC